MSTLILDYSGFNVNAWSFAADLLAKVLERPNNICLSPFSVQTCFALITEAAAGDTQKQLIDVLKLPADYLTQFSDILDSIDQSESTIKIANSFWLNNKFKLNKEFMSKILENFKDAEGTECDFNSEEQRSKYVLKINSWVRQKTTGHIQKIIQHIDPASTLLLINAVYFDGIWKHAFKAEKTIENAKFHALDSTVIKTAMMTQETKLQFIEHNDFKAVMLPYEGDDTCLYAILPSKLGKEALDHVLSGEFLTEFLTRHKEQMKPVAVNVKFPKFKFVNDYDMVPILKAMGVEDVFDSRIADLNKLIVGKSEGLCVSQTIHKSFFEVDEEMTKASAVAVEEEFYSYEKKLERSFGTKARKRKQEMKIVHEFHADRPFAFIVYHHQTQQILFLGKIIDPLHKGDNDKKRAVNTIAELVDEKTSKKKK